MNYQAEFNKNSSIIWDFAKHKPKDFSHLQGAMFMDRPDLWHRLSKPQRGKKPGHPDQLAFNFFSDNSKAHPE